MKPRRRKSQNASSVPTISFMELKWMIDGGKWLGHEEIVPIWNSICESAGATEPPGRYEFITALLSVRDRLYSVDETVEWERLPLMAIREGTPKFFEFCVIQ